jgi:DNA-directed RNA polymerase II subunit RPB2
MISPDSIFSFSASIIPLPGTLLSTRVSYQCSKGNQALGIYASNYPIRMDQGAKVLAWPSRPIFKTHMHDTLGMGDLPGGETAVIAIMPWGGYNQEDAIIISEHAVKRGLFTHIVYHILTSTLVKSDDFVEKFGPPPSREGRNKFLFEAVGDDGLPIVGKYVKEGQAFACKHRRIHGVAKPVIKVDRDKISFASEGIIERVIRNVNSDGTEGIRIKIRQAAKPLVGDKINLASGSQKSTISKILPDDQMPYMIGVDGRKIYPDLIFNPHSIPSRKTVGTLMDIVVSKAAVYEGREIDATGFRPFDLDTSINYLKSRGFDPYGREVMYHPESGKRIEASIFAGLAYYNVLPQMVRGKIRARNKGPLKAMTRQPSRGGDASTATGLRLGTQESTALISHGASELIHERFVKASDEFVQPFCITCGRPASYNVNTGTVACKFCEEKAAFGKVAYPYPFKTLIQLMEGVGLGYRFGFTDEVPFKEKQPIPAAVAAAEEM